MLAALMLASPDAGAFTGTLDKELIMKGIRSQTPTARHCFEEPGGKLVVRFVIGPDGSVTESELAEPTTCSNKTVSCVLKAMKGVKTDRHLTVTRRDAVQRHVTSTSGHGPRKRVRNQPLGGREEAVTERALASGHAPAPRARVVDRLSDCSHREAARGRRAPTLRHHERAGARVVS